MDDHPHPEHPTEPTPWPQVLKSAKEELRWLAETLGMVALTLALARLIQKLGVDLSSLTNSSRQELMKKAWQQEEKKP